MVILIFEMPDGKTVREKADRSAAAACWGPHWQSQEALQRACERKGARSVRAVYAGNPIAAYKWR